MTPVRAIFFDEDDARAVVARLRADGFERMLRRALLKALAGPFPDIAFCPTGGITPDNMADYLTAGASGFGLGGSLYRPGESPGQVEQHARAFVTAWQEWKNATDD